MSSLKVNAAKFNALSLRERIVVALVLLVLISFAWWYLYAQPAMMRAELLTAENQRIASDVNTTEATITGIRARIASGVHGEKQQKLVQLKQQLDKVEESLRLKTVELVDPEDMFELLSSLVYKKSKLKLMSLKRREVKPAIAQEEGQKGDAGIYRHVLEVKFSGKYADILSYMQSLEKLDWKLIWDEIEIISGEYPNITVKLVISTLSTRKEWVGV